VALFLLASGVFAFCFVRFRTGVPIVYGVLPGASLAYLPVERARRGMLGDAGSNMLGGVLGLGMGMTLSPPAKLAVVALLLGFHYFTERRSLNAWIKAHPALDRVDRWLQGSPRGEAGEGEGP
jgi:hypothetical protein